MATAPLRIAARMAHIEPFEVMEIQTLARQVEAEGKDVIHLEIGEPDFRTPRPILEAAQRALVRGHWGARTRMAMVASPANPTGTLVTPEEAHAMAEVVRAKGGTLLVDEIYHGLTYGLDARTAAEEGEDVFVVNSFSKYFQMT